MTEIIEKQNNSFEEWLKDIKNKVKYRQTRATFSANSELILLYWELGKMIVEQKAETVYGSGFYKKLSEALKNEFPNTKGFSTTNLKYMKRFYLFYQHTIEIRQQGVDDFESILLVPWSHHIHLMTRCKDYQEALFYIEQIIENGWGRDTLLDKLDKNLYLGHGQSITNFSKRLPSPFSETAQDTLKDPYFFDFITLADGYKERELENALVSKVKKLLQELGENFAFVAQQKEICAGSKTHYIDLLFYHLDLRCYIVVELKRSEFDISFISQIGFYVTAVNNLLKKNIDNPTIGLLICKTKDNVEVKWALQSSSEPIGVSEYRLEKLTESYKSILPSVEELESSIKNIEDE